MAKMMRMSLRAWYVFGVFLCLMAGNGTAQRTHGGMYTPERLANIRHNAVNDVWTVGRRNAAVSNALPWRNMSDEKLWSMIPAQSLPRCIDVTWDYDFPSNLTLGCLNCGDAITDYGNYPYKPDFVNKPWKLTCPSCNVVFPTNDFGAYYESGINARGEFDPTVADGTLLFNTAHPDPSDPLHKYGVDNGYGYVDGNGREHKFIGYYVWQYWRYVLGGVNALAEAYVYTGEKIYARKAAIMLDRIADVYPAMDWKPYADRGWFHSDGGSKKGKIEGRIWENQTIQHLAIAYDKIISGTVDNPELYAFLASKGTEFVLRTPKGTRQNLISNIDANLLEVGAAAIQSQRIWGNEGMHQRSMSCVAVSLNTNPKTGELLDWVFAPSGGHLPTMLVQLFDRDGMANEAAPGYCFLWPGQIRAIMEILEPYEGYTRNRVSRDYPWIKNIFTAPWRVQALNTFTPNIGDTGATGLINLGISAATVATGFEFFNDPEAARFAYEANGNSAVGLLMNPGTTTPDVMRNLLEQAALNYEKPPPLGEHLAAYGLATIEFGNDKTGKSLWSYYGRTTGHGHRDRLNYSLYAFGVDLSPDLGYPAFAAASYAPRSAWTNNTISHNTVVVDKSPQLQNYTGHPRFFVTSPGFGAFELESKNAYAQTSEYARTMAFIEMPDKNAYAVDIFRVTGGTDHLMSFHGPPGSVTVSGGDFVVQPTGSYAGPHVPYGSNTPTYPLGYSYLKNVSRATAPPENMWINWRAQPGYRGVKSSDNINLRLHIMGQLDDLALADGVPAQNKPGNPESIRYALMHRKNASGVYHALQSQFVSVVEPWKMAPFISNVTRMSLMDANMDEVVAVRINPGSGIMDYIISNPNRKDVRVLGGPTTNGAFAWVRTTNGQVTSASLTRGSVLSFGSDFVLPGTGDITGQLVRFERDPTRPMCAWVTMTAGEAMDLKGSQIYFANDGSQTACYDVLDVTPDGPTWKLTCGPGSFIRSFKNAADYSAGYIYNIVDGTSFYSPVTAFYSPSDNSGVNDALTY